MFAVFANYKENINNRAYITQKTDRWQSIFWFLSICGGITAIVIFPLLTTRIFFREIEKQNGLLGIGVALMIVKETPPSMQNSGIF